MWKLAAKFLIVPSAKVLMAPATKLIVGAILVFSVAAVEGLPIHDPWFDLVLFSFSSGIVGGMPEPDTQLSLPRFLYTWAYRTAHLWVSAATAYFIHQNKWTSIHDGVEASPRSSSTSTGL